MMITGLLGSERRRRVRAAPREDGHAAAPVQAAPRDAAAVPAEARAAPAGPAAIADGIALIAPLPAWRRLRTLY